MTDTGFALTPEQRTRVALSMETAYVAVVIAPDATLSPEAFRAAWATLAQKHELLTMATGQVEGFRGIRHLPQAPAKGLPWIQVRAAGPSADAAALALAAGPMPEEATSRQANACAIWLNCEASVDATGSGPRLILMARAWLFDEASLMALAQELVAHAQGEEVSDDDAPLRYQDFASWRDGLVEGEDGLDGQAYWRRYLDEAGSPRTGVRLPAHHRLASSDASTRDIASHAARRAVPAAVGTALVAMAQARGTATDLLLQAAWWALLARIGGQTSVDGVVCHDCRSDYGPLAGSLGVFERRMPVRVRLDDTLSLVDVACRLNETIDEHRNWQETVPTSLANHALAAFRLLVWDTPATLARLVGLISPLGTAECHLDLVTDARGALTQFTLASDIGAYPPDAVEVLADQYLTMLSSLAAQASRADSPWQHIDVTPALEKARYLSWAGPELKVPDETVIHAMLRHAQETPDGMAIEGDGKRLTWSELAGEVLTVSANLQKKGVRTGDTVALAMPRSVDMVIALLATMRAGGAYVPLDPSWPAARIHAVLSQAKPVLAVVAPPFGATQEASLAPLVSFAGLAQPTAGDATLAAPRGTDRAYVIFTSGSTGVPKGVPIGHRQLANYAHAIAGALTLSPDHRVALTSTVAADLGNTALFGAIAAGACLVVANEADMADGAAFARFVGSTGVDVVKITPSHLDALVQIASPVLPSTVVLGGEATQPSLVGTLRRIRPDVRIVNHYGPTETTVGVLIHVCGDETSTGPDIGALPLTQPLANCYARVLDDDLSITPVGARGMLYVGGEQLTAGYLGRDAREGFVDDPFTPGARLYRTGDVARWLPQGGIQWLGRADEQVKIRGHRVEPAEIEAACRDIPGVTQVAVRAWGSGTQTELAAYVIAPEMTDAPKRVRDTLTNRLPAAWVPAFVVTLASIPRLANGKVDRQALANPRCNAMAGGGAAIDVAPQTPLETWLAKRLEDLLGRTPIGVTRSLFELGGDSLTVIRFVARIGEGLHIEVLPGQVFATPTVRALANALHARADGGETLVLRAQARLTFDALPPEAQAALLERARQTSNAAS
ncbi:Plipastatin synthase subunit C [Pandoraea horticolens]|uniref:Plipastatin synthase subunit C n=1 Tax=Pandoraea horticolens TaxID=2508298 RepID=A0A5E4WJW9_9BURK|nr:amino acid adenylation domain-containing protein [Pandoraea horticolens]VVE23346.1 Plipastatin synthase subunit C [Pandoraea horticolens]